MNEINTAGERNADRQLRIELNIESMRRAAGRMTDDLRKAPRKKYPRQYAESAINDAEYVFQNDREKAQTHIERLEPDLNSIDLVSSISRQLENEALICTILASNARAYARTLSDFDGLFGPIASDDMQSAKVARNC